ncbi:MAG: metallophosphoesterase [Phycisphaerae bacterium]|nr:metallophosphoesterase [Phycisphaerae bacterium]
MGPIVDPRLGDLEDDASSTKQHSLFSLAGSLLAEISLPKLIAAWLILVVIPAVLLGLAPVVALGWAGKLAGKIAAPLLGILPIALFLGVVALGWFFGRTLFRLAESNFWSLNALVVEPAYAMCREALRHVAERISPESLQSARRKRLRFAATVLSGLIISAVAVLVAMLAWPSSRWVGGAADLFAPRQLAWIALANTVVLICAYLAVAALVWTVADVITPAPQDLRGFQPRTPGARSWRVAHLSDLHTVGERYGFRIESGRAGPSGNGRLQRVLEVLEELDASAPLDAILITGDATDAGRAAEWAEFLDAVAAHPKLAGRVLMIPGNHDVNIVDRANPARLDLSIGPNSRLRKIRALSAMNSLQGSRVHVIDHASRRAGKTLADALEPHAAMLSRFADAGRPYFSTEVSDLWNDVFPMVLPPDREDGLGIVLLNSNADAHFSFTNALGMISAEQMRGIEIVSAEYPRACWLIALHHHVVEYPRAAKVLSERIGTALVNGNWFLRSLQPLEKRIVLMHGHRHIDWIGECSGLVIVSAPSPVMEATNDLDTCFYVHTLEAGSGLALLEPQRVTVRGEPASGHRLAGSSGQARAVGAAEPGAGSRCGHRLQGQ